MACWRRLPGYPAALIVGVLAVLLLVQGKVAPVTPLLVLVTTYFIAGRLHALVVGQVNIIAGYYSEATRKLEEARVDRGKMASLTKELEEAYERIKYANFQLQHAYRAAEEARQLKAQFAANVSHELRTPINLIVGFAEVMVTSPESYGARLPAAYRPDILSIYRNAQHLQSLINDILDISQIEAESLSLTKEETDLVVSLREAGEIAKDLIERKGLEFVFDCPPALPAIWIDRTRIRQVTLNLLANAVRFTDQGRITLTARQVGDELQVAVIDTGIGLAEKDRERIFEEFYQTDGSLSRRTGGTGLGLALSRRFVREHGGRIWVESDGLGKGSTFYYTLPIHGVISSRLSRTKGPAPKEEWSILVQDEDAAITQLFQRYARAHTIKASHSVQNSVALAEVSRPASMVVADDQYDPAMADLIWKNSPATTLIVCPMPSGRRAMKAYGLADCLVKPIVRQSLVDAIARLAAPMHKVLVIDDNPDVVRMLRRMLFSIDTTLQVYEAYSGKEGLAAALQVFPDLVLLDILMPDLDGFVVAQRMKEEHSLKEIPIIVVSAYGAQDLIIPRVEGGITIRRAEGFTPLELVKCAEAITSVFTGSDRRETS